MTLDRFIPQTPDDIGDIEIHIKQVKDEETGVLVETAVYQYELIDEEGVLIEFKGTSGDIKPHISNARKRSIKEWLDEFRALLVARHLPK